MSGSTADERRVPWKLLSKAPLATALPPHRLGNHTATQCLPQLTLCKTRTDSYKPWEPPGFFRDHFLESLNIVTVPLGTWYGTKFASPCHTTLGLLPHSQPCRDICIISAHSQQAGPVQAQDQLRFTQPQENKPVLSSPAALCPHPSNWQATIHAQIHWPSSVVLEGPLRLLIAQRRSQPLQQNNRVSAGHGWAPEMFRKDS